jgi:hypothetical protein
MTSLGRTKCRWENSIVTNMTIAGQQFGKHVPATMDRLNTCCYEGRSLQTSSVQGAFPWHQTFSTVTSRLYKEPCREEWFITRVDACSNTSTVTLRVVGGDKKRSLESETVLVRVPRNSDPRINMLARASSNCKWQIRPLVRESAPHQQTRNYVTVIKIWS